MAAARVTAWKRPHPHETLPFLPHTLPFVATSLPFLAAILPLLPPITRNVKFRWAAKGLNSALARRRCPAKDQKAAKTAMLTAPVNIAIRNQSRG
jgi:hypothetical protein